MSEAFNVVSVGLPAQEFYVRCQVAVERQVPVMTEFAVRLLHVVERLPIDAFASYFGLRARECRDLLNSLAQEGLVEEQDGSLVLTSYAAARFVTSEDGVPRFTRIAERQTRTVFDLATFTPLPGRVASTGYWDNALELDWSREQATSSNTIDRATEAFHRHFSDIERINHQDESRRAFSVYKVEEIAAGKRNTLPIPIIFTIDVDGQVNYDFAEELEFLPEALRSRVIQLAAKRIGALEKRPDQFQDFVTVFEDEVLRRYMHAEGLRFGDYVREVHASGSGATYDTGQTSSVLGALYMPRNRPLLLAGIKKAFGEIAKLAEEQRSNELFWVLPENALWGRAELLKELVQTIHQAADDELGTALEITAVCDVDQSDAPNRLQQKARPLLDAGFSDVLLGPGVTSAERFELMLMPGAYMAALYHASASDSSVNVPVGFQTSNKRKLKKAMVFLQRACQTKLHRAYRGGEPGDRQITLAEVSAGDFLYFKSYTQSDVSAQVPGA